MSERHTSKASRVARIIAEHPRCVAWGANLQDMRERPLPGKAERPQCGEANFYVQGQVIERWLEDVWRQVCAITLEAKSGDDACTKLTVGAIVWPSESSNTAYYVDVIVVTVCLEGVTFKVAIETVR